MYWGLYCYLACVIYCARISVSVLFHHQVRFVELRNFTIIIHSSAATISRLDHIFKQYHRNVTGVNYLVVYPAGTTPHPAVPALVTKCAPVRDTVNGLNCRNQEAYEYFLKNDWMGDFLYRAMDDTVLSIENLKEYVIQLRQIYDPYTEVVFRGGINHETRLNPDLTSWLGGGSGWLQSRAMVAVHTLPGISMIDMHHDNYTDQDDMTETRILHRLGFKDEDWEEPLMADNCHPPCNGTLFRMSKVRLGRCSGNFFSMNDIIAFHTADHKPENVETGLMIGTYPPNIYYMLKVNKRGVNMCYRRRGIVNEKVLFEYRKEHAVHMTFEEAAKRVKYTDDIWKKFIDGDPRSELRPFVQFRFVYEMK